MFANNGYSSKANANRAAKANGYAPEQFYATQDPDGRWHVVEYAVAAPKETSTVDSPVRVVWGIVGSMLGARRRDQMAECLRAGVAKYTARTQIQLARGYHLGSQPA